MNQLKTLDLNILPIETLAEMANEAGEQVENNAKATVQKAIDCGRYLTAIKEQLEHGEWLPWLGANWNYSRKTAAQYMQISNVTCGLHLKDAESINDALRMIADSKPETAPRSARKPADVVVTTPKDDPDDDYDDVGTVEDYPAGDFGPPLDTDPPPDPPTIRTTPAGTTKVSEDKKPRTQQVAVELVEEEPNSEKDHSTGIVDAWLSANTLSDVLDNWFDADETPKQRAKYLRKLADKLDPPTKFRKPDLDDVTSYFKELKSPAFEDFFDYYESNGWLVGRVAMKDWKSAARKWARTNGSNGNGTHQRTGKRGLTADEVFS